MYMYSTPEDRVRQEVGFPSPPTLEVVSDALVELTWEAPASTGLTLYSLYWRSADNSHWQHFTTVTIIIYLHE